MPRSILSPEVIDLMNEAQLGHRTYYPSPADWRDVWIYFLVTDRFAHPTAPPRERWDAEVNGYQGGTFAGIQRRLDYLRDLGVGALWISPVLKNPQFDGSAYHGYGVQDFLAIDPRFSSDPARARREPSFVEDELRALVDAAHAHGIYVIFDVVLNHVGNVFAYEGDRHDIPWTDAGPQTIWWRDADGKARPDWTTPPTDPELSADALVWPVELQQNDYFRRMGNAFSRPMDIHELAGDFYALKELVTEYEVPHAGGGVHFPVRHILTTTHQYLIAKFDIDGFRIDTLKYIEPAFAREFGAAVREYALTIGKKNFFTFGEVYDGEEKISHFIGRTAQAGDDLVGVDAALDFPLFFKLGAVAKGQLAPIEVVRMFERRAHVTQGLISSQGEASRYFVSFLDNHDQTSRVHYVDPAAPERYDDQTTLALALLFCLQGIPCVYYGTEQGLAGRGGGMEAVREALWGKPGAFDPSHPFYRTIQALSALRHGRASLRYGRQYFRPISGDGGSFGFSSYAGGVLAFSRIMADLEVVVVANTHHAEGWQGETLVDFTIRPSGSTYELLFSNRRVPTPDDRQAVIAKADHELSFVGLDGGRHVGTGRAIRVALLPSEVQVWGKGL